MWENMDSTQKRSTSMSKMQESVLGQGKRMKKPYCCGTRMSYKAYDPKKKEYKFKCKTCSKTKKVKE